MRRVSGRAGEGKRRRRGREKTHDQVLLVRFTDGSIVAVLPVSTGGFDEGGV